MNRRNPDWDIDRADGEWGEWTVAALLRGDTVEVKYDREFVRTSNLYVEYRCKRASGWAPSGIAATKADHYAFVLADGLVLVVDTPTLRTAARWAWRDKGKRRECKVGSHPTEGIVLTVADLMAASTHRAA